MSKVKEEVLDYIQDKNIRGLLKTILEQICLQRPERPAHFIIEYLQKEFSIKPEGGEAEERSDSDHESEEGHSEDDVYPEDEPEPEPVHRPVIGRRKRRGAVSAESFDPDKFKVADKKIYPKTADSIERVSNALSKNMVLKSIDSEQKKEIIDAMFEKSCTAGDVLIKQGDLVADNFYVIEEGECDIWVKKEGMDEPKCVSTVHAGDSFGELALLYPQPRAATVKARTDCRLWAIDRQSFQRILQSRMYQKRKMYEGFLGGVKILQELKPYERSIIADALIKTEYTKGQDIVTQGEPGDTFYIVEEGEVTISRKDAPDAESMEVATLGVRDYFGEVALISRENRQATVTVKSDICKCVSLDRDAFSRLLGSCNDIMRRNMTSYNLYMASKI